MDDIIETLNSFNNRVERLENSNFTKRFKDKSPEVFLKLENTQFENLGNGNFILSGKIESWIDDYNEDEVNSIVLAYRMFTQNNDRISISSLSKIYNSDWFPEEGRDCFNDANHKVNSYLDSIATVCFEKGYITIRSIMDIIIYGGLAHSNLKKERIFNSWMSSDASGLFKVEFITALKTMLFYFSYFKELNITTLALLKEQQSLSN